MILSRTSQYALQALVYLATQPGGRPILGRDIAARTAVPPAYLAKVMQLLVKANLVRSFRGQQGGFFLEEGAKDISLIKIVSLTEGREFTQVCVLGRHSCTKVAPCPIHCEWQPIKRAIAKILGESRLGPLAEGVRSGRCRLADVSLAAFAECKA